MAGKLQTQYKVKPVYSDQGCFTEWRKIQWFQWHSTYKPWLFYLWAATTCLERPPDTCGRSRQVSLFVWCWILIESIELDLYLVPCIDFCHVLVLSNDLSLLGKNFAKYVGLFVCLSVCLLLGKNICQVCWSVCMFVCLFVCMSRSAAITKKVLTQSSPNLVSICTLGLGRSL